MGLLDSLLGKITGGTGGGTESQVLNAVVGMLGNKESGGLSGLVDTLKKNGLGDIVSSWVGTGANKPITAEQITQGLGNAHINALASKAGISPEMVSSTLAKILPNVVDKLTPDGKIPTDELIQKGLSLFKGM
jgi:uncharacterized protein YidB (DUF937 family)